MIHIDTDLTTRYLQAMVRIDSINPGLVPGGAGEGEIARWLAATCESLGLEVRLQETAPGRPNVIARWRGSVGGKSLLLTGHTDTVGVENMLGDPFDARVEEGRLYGRGSFDMKGGLASMLGALAALRSMSFAPRGDLWLGFVTDEEYLSIGTDALVKEIHADAAILTEPTACNLCIAHKGFAWLTITTHGFATHGSLYPEGVDAIAHMGRVLTALETMERDILPQRSHTLLGRPSVHASLINGGLGLSTYPDSGQLQIEHRLLPDETGDDALRLWNDALHQLNQTDPRFRADVSLDFFRPGLEVERDAPIVQSLREALIDGTGKEPEYFGMWAWMDSAILGRASIPTVIFGPGGTGAHAAVEYVNLADVFTCASVLAETAVRWCS
jgi:acetylornithine deacetylase